MDPSSCCSLWMLLVPLGLCTVATGFFVPHFPGAVTAGTPSQTFNTVSIKTIGHGCSSTSSQLSSPAGLIGVIMSGSMTGASPFSPEVLALLNDKGLEVKELSEENLPAAIDIEAASYPEDEAASPDNMTFRRANAGQFFLEATIKNGGGRELVGFVCSTCSSGEELSHESMHLHDPNGQTLCIHSVAVAEKFRRRGYATAMLKAYVENVALNHPGIRRVCLIAKAKLLGMYASCGFSLKGLSPVVHGKDPWFEMRIDLDTTEPRLLRFVQVDSFTEKIFCGNPAAVFFTQGGGDSEWMQKVAVEMNLSETCFLELQLPSSSEAKAPSAGPEYALRWFTPGGEVDLCGHATLAAAFALWEEGRADRALPIRFSTASGVLTCRCGEDGWIAMDFPAEFVGDPLSDQDESRVAIIQALGLAAGEDVLFVGRNRFDIMVEVTPEAFSTLQPDMRLLAATKSRGAIVTCLGQGGIEEEASPAVDASAGSDFVSRFFAPGLGIDEDPVTGSAHCCLAPYWASKLGRNTLLGYQASPRGGTVRATLEKREGLDRVILEGKAVAVFRGLLRR